VLIETPRLILRPIAFSDLDNLVALGSDPQVTEFVARLDRGSAEERIGMAEREWREHGYGMFAVLQRHGERFVGRAGLKYWPQFGETEVGWVLRRDAWGHGYATEAGRACVEWGFAEFRLPYVTAMIQHANQRSIRVAERLGFEPTRDEVLDGDPVIVFARRPDTGKR
jgi:RimJ/RimL family protein N-acetyltransferase